VRRHAPPSHPGAALPTAASGRRVLHRARTYQETSAFESEVLRANPLGDPHVRPLFVYLPPGYDEESERRWPSVYVIQGLTGRAEMWFNVAAFQQNYAELVEELAPPAVVVLVDVFTALGGSQYLDSPATGPTRPVTPEVAGSSPVAPVSSKCLQIGAWRLLIRRTLRNSGQHTGSAQLG
jgi:hypothetical protein